MVGRTGSLLSGVKNGILSMRGTRLIRLVRTTRGIMRRRGSSRCCSGARVLLGTVGIKRTTVRLESSYDRTRRMCRKESMGRS